MTCIIDLNEEKLCISCCFFVGTLNIMMKLIFLCLIIQNIHDLGNSKIWRFLFVRVSFSTSSGDQLWSTYPPSSSLKKFYLNLSLKILRIFCFVCYIIDFILKILSRNVNRIVIVYVFNCLMFCLRLIFFSYILFVVKLVVCWTTRSYVFFFVSIG